MYIIRRNSYIKRYSLIQTCDIVFEFPHGAVGESKCVIEVASVQVDNGRCHNVVAFVSQWTLLHVWVVGVSVVRGSQA